MDRPPQLSVSEAKWQAQVVELLQLLGFELLYHTYDSRRSPAGFPDLVAIRFRPQTGRWTLLFVELKSERGVVRPSQVDWLAALEAIALIVNRRVSGVELVVDVWRPRDWERIVERLAA